MIGALAALGSSVTWAIGTQVYPKLASEYSPFEVNGGRALVALPLFFVLSLIVGGAQGWALVGTSHVGWLLLSMISSYFLGDACFMWSTRALGIPGALAVASSYPVWTAFAGVLFRGEILASRQWLGIALAVLGTVVVILSGYSSRRSSQAAGEEVSGFGAGVVFGLLTSGFWALNSWAVAEGGKGISPWVGNSIRMIIALVLCGSASSLLRRRPVVSIPYSTLRPYLPIFALEAFGGSLLFIYGLTHASLAVAAALSSLAPVISVPISGLRGMEPISLTKTIGVCLAVLGAVILLVGA